MKSATTKERVARVGERRQVVIPREILETLKLRAGDLVAFTAKKNGVLIRPKRAVHPDDTLTAEEAALVKKAEREMRRGKYVTLDQLHHDLDRPRSRGRRKTS